MAAVFSPDGVVSSACCGRLKVGLTHGSGRTRVRGKINAPSKAVQARAQARGVRFVMQTCGEEDWPGPGAEAAGRRRSAQYERPSSRTAHVCTYPALTDVQRSAPTRAGGGLYALAVSRPSWPRRCRPSTRVRRRHRWRR